MSDKFKDLFREYAEMFGYEFEINEQSEDNTEEILDSIRGKLGLPKNTTNNHFKRLKESPEQAVDVAEGKLQGRGMRVKVNPIDDGCDIDVSGAIEEESNPKDVIANIMQKLYDEQGIELIATQDISKIVIGGMRSMTEDEDKALAKGILRMSTPTEISLDEDDIVEIKMWCEECKGHGYDEVFELDYVDSIGCDACDGLGYIVKKGIIL